METLGNYTLPRKLKNSMIFGQVKFDTHVHPRLRHVQVVDGSICNCDPSKPAECGPWFRPIAAFASLARASVGNVPPKKIRQAERGHVNHS